MSLCVYIAKYAAWNMASDYTEDVKGISKSIKTGIPLRLFDIMGAGGFLITNYQSEITQYFDIDKELVVYDSMECFTFDIALNNIFDLAGIS